MPAAERTRLMYLLPRYDAASPEHLFHLYGFLSKLRGRVDLEILVERMRGTPPDDLPARPLRIGFAPLRLGEEVIRFLAARLRGVRIFYVHYSYTGAIAASIITRLLGGTAYYWNCSLFEMFRPAAGAGWREWFRFRLNRFLLKTSVRWCHHLVTGTPRMAAYYAGCVGIREESIRVLPNFIDIGRFRGIDRGEARRRLNLDPRRKTVLFLHRVAPRKGAQFLPQILRAIARDSGPATLLVAGDGPYLPQLRERIRLEGLESMTDFRGWVANREAPAYFHAADLYLMPSVEEGFPRVLLEAMASDCPFVAFDVGGVRDVLSPRQRECLADAGDVDAFSALCVRALRSPDLADGWRLAGAERVKRFSEENVLEAFVRMAAGDSLKDSGFFAGRGAE